MTSMELSLAGALVSHERLAASRAIAPGPKIFVVPAFNEEDNLPRLLNDLEGRPELFPNGSRLIVVDDGSEDSTPDCVRGYEGPLPVELVRLEPNQGPGAAFRAGFAAAMEGCPSNALIVTLEADTTSNLDALPAMIERAEAGAELVLADWTMHNVAARRRLLSAAAGYVVRLLLGVEARTVSSFFRVYRASTLAYGLRHYGDSFIRESGFACKAEILAKLVQLGAKVEEVPVDLDWEKRVGKSKMPVGRTILGYWRMMLRHHVGTSTAE
jgi:dolichol-phosphate mannosyltransferase